MTLRARNRVTWAVMLVLLAVLALQARDNFERLFVGVGTLDVRDEPAAETVYLRWHGRIEAPMASRLAAAFNRYKSARRSFVLSLASPGGSLNHGAEVISLLSGLQATHRLHTIVESGAMCASMCVPVYLQGARRTAAANAKFMFHEVSYSEFFSGRDSRVPNSAIGSATDLLFERYFTTAGVPAPWIKTIRAEMAGGNDVWKTGRQLVDEQTGIVQKTF